RNEGENIFCTRGSADDVRLQGLRPKFPLEMGDMAQPGSQICRCLMQHARMLAQVEGMQLKSKRTDTQNQWIQQKHSKAFSPVGFQTSADQQQVFQEPGVLDVSLRIRRIRADEL